MEGKICLITGGSDGIGYVAARELARMGATVVVAGRNNTKTSTTVSPGFSIPRSSCHEGRRMFLPEATSVKMRSSLSPWSLRIRRWVASPLSPSAWETRM